VTLTRGQLAGIVVAGAGGLVVLAGLLGDTVGLFDHLSPDARPWLLHGFTVVVAGLTIGLVGLFLLVGFNPLAPFVRLWRRVAAVSIWWPHQVIQTGVTVAAAIAAGFLGRGWMVPVIVVGACALVAVDAGAEGRAVERRRRDKLRSVRRNG